MRYFPLFFSCSTFQNWWLFYIYNTSQIELDTLQVLCSHVWLTAANTGQCRCLIHGLLIQVHLLLYSHSVVSDSLRPHELQPAGLPCPSSSPRVHSNSCPLSQWCHPTISSSATSSSCLNISQHQGLFQWVGTSWQVVKILELQQQLFQQIFRVDFL